MIKVITYGTFDLLHQGHINILKRAKALGDYLYVGVTSDGFDKGRGKINVRQSVLERVEAVRATGLADEIIIEEYEGQKIDDIIRLGIDIFTVGSDWEGKFDYLNEYCKVIYLTRTEGVSSTGIRTSDGGFSIGLVGDPKMLKKFEKESRYVNGVRIAGVYSENSDVGLHLKETAFRTENYGELLDRSDAVYIASNPIRRYGQVKEALLRGKHVLCETPVALSKENLKELFDIARGKNCLLINAIKTAYSMAYSRLRLLVKGGCIGRVISVDATCTSLKKWNLQDKKLEEMWGSLCDWGPIAMLPVFQILGTEYTEKEIASRFADYELRLDTFTKVSFLYPTAVASVKVGSGVKSEGELIISGTRGYIYVPAPWWKTDYFEIRYENPQENKRFFFQSEGEGIRYEIVSFLDSVKNRCREGVAFI